MSIDEPDGAVAPEAEEPPLRTHRRSAIGAAAAERLAAVCFALAALAAIGLAVVYWEGGQTQLEGALLAVATGAIGIGIVVWAKRFMPDEEVVEEREPLRSSEDDVDAFRRDFEHGEQTVAGRRLLVGTLGGALAAMGAALVFPIRSLGPRPGRGLKRTAYADARGRDGGIRLVRRGASPDEEAYIRPDELAADGVLTVWPEGHLNEADTPTLIIRTRESQQLKLAENRRDWVVEGIVGYSKLCTHVGCPVGLYQAAEGKLLCPCHQSTFNVLEGAKPIFGPAARALPQLPLDVDDDGYLIATDDFSSPVGPGFWDRDR